jgi:hypothetical protein
LIKKTFEGFGDFKTGGQVICSVKNADNSCKYVRTQAMFDRPVGVRRCYGMETLVEKTKLPRV